MATMTISHLQALFILVLVLVLISSSSSLGSGTSTLLDERLRLAEMNKITISVGHDGYNGDFHSIQEALATIPPHNTRRVVILVKPGVYREKIAIPKTLPFITFVGDSTDPPTITGNDTASLPGKDGTPLRTFQSATVAVDGDYFVAVNIKFEVHWDELRIELYPEFNGQKSCIDYSSKDGQLIIGKWVFIQELFSQREWQDLPWESLG
ncbi:Probable pectinesterase 68 [Linum perenne]